MGSLLEVRDLVTRFRSDGALIHAVNGVSLALDAGASLAIVGESGSGKSVSMMSVMRLIGDPPGRIEGGEVLFEGQDLLRLSEAEMRRVRGRRIAMIFQDPMTSLNPVLTIGLQMVEMIRLHLGLSERAARERAAEMLALVGLARARERLDDYPHQFSGGQRQRIMIALALSCDPALLIADEPTTALDVTVQAQIVELIQDLREKLGMAVIWISHNLGLVAGVVERVVVMYGGHVVEEAPVDALYAAPLHPYTQGLLRSIPRMDEDSRTRLFSIEGMPPDLRLAPQACPFAPRCTHAEPRCRAELPPLRAWPGGRQVRCWRAGEVGGEACGGEA